MNLKSSLRLHIRVLDSTSCNVRGELTRFRAMNAIERVVHAYTFDHSGFRPRQDRKPISLNARENAGKVREDFG